MEIIRSAFLILQHIELMARFASNLTARSAQPPPACRCLRCPVKEECLDRLVPIGEQHFRRAMAEYVAHDDAERPYQGCGNMLLWPASPSQRKGRIRRRPRLGGLLNYDARAA